MRPVRVDSRIPKGPTSFRNESIRLGLAELCVWISRCRGRGEGKDLHFHNTVVGANIQNLATELVSQASDSI